MFKEVIRRAVFIKQAIRKQMVILPLFLLLSGQACADKHSTEQSLAQIPLSVDSVETHRVDKSLIRIIQYNMELNPRLEIERLTTPDVTLAQKVIIEKIKLKNETIDFKDSSGTYIESLNLKKGIISFTIEHSYPDISGGEIFLECQINVKDNNIAHPVCAEKPQ